MATAAQLNANRANAQLCTGPKTEVGKESSSQNSLKHGLYSRRVVLPHESQDQYDALLAEMTNHYQPVGPQEANFVREVVDNQWKLERARRIEMQLLESLVQSDADLANCMTSGGFPELDRIARVIARAESAWYRSIACLDRLQSARRREELRQARASAAEARKAAAKSRRKSEEMMQEILSPSDYRKEIGFVSSPTRPASPVTESLIAAGRRAGVI